MMTRLMITMMAGLMFMLFAVLQRVLELKTTNFND